MNPRTIAAQAMGWIDETTKAIVAPIHPSTTYIRDPDNQYRNNRAYARADNPTFDQAEATLAALEKAHAALVFSSARSKFSSANETFPTSRCSSSANSGVNVCFSREMKIMMPTTRPCTNRGSAAPEFALSLRALP